MNQFSPFKVGPFTARHFVHDLLNSCGVNTYLSACVGVGAGQLSDLQTGTESCVPKRISKKCGFILIFFKNCNKTKPTNQQKPT